LDFAVSPDTFPQSVIEEVIVILLGKNSEKHRGGQHQQFDFKRKENIAKHYKKTACRYGFQGQEIHY